MDQTGVEISCGKNATCVGAVGSFTIIDTENLRGRFLVECDTLTPCYTTPCPDSYGVLWIQQDIHKVDIPKGATKLDGSGYWSVRYRRNKDKSIPGDWHLGDETGTNIITYVDTLRGQFGVDWHDLQGNLLHRGFIYTHTDDNEITTGYLVQPPYLNFPKHKNNV